MLDEIRVLEENKTWVLEDLPPGKNPSIVSGYRRSCISSMIY